MSKLLTDWSERGWILIDEDDSSALPGEALRDRRADNAAGAGHHRDPVRKLRHYSPSVGRDAVAAAAAKDRRTTATPLRITMGTMTSSVEIAVSVGSIS